MHEAFRARVETLEKVSDKLMKPALITGFGVSLSDDEKKVGQRETCEDHSNHQAIALRECCQGWHTGKFGSDQAYEAEKECDDHTGEGDWGQNIDGPLSRSRIIVGAPVKRADLRLAQGSRIEVEIV